MSVVVLRCGAGTSRRMSVLGNLAFPEKFFYNIYEILLIKIPSRKPK
jgi:hypothetical protein